MCDVVKPVEDFRNYEDSARHSVVSNHYKQMRTNQTLDFSRKMAKKYSFESPRAYMTIHEAFDALKSYVDSSDPDTELPNALHMLQTAEGIRKAGHPEWMQVVGLLHDMGKIMFLWGEPEEGQEGTATGAQWALGGDTWVVGCELPDTMVFPEYNKLNPDMSDELLSSKYGIYAPNCGFDALEFAYGHDEYMYQMLIANEIDLPKEGLAMIRLHSCYPWHTGKSYTHLMNDEDKKTLQDIIEFNKYDLYTKTFDDATIKDINLYELECWKHYDELLKKFKLDGKLKW